MSCSHSLGSSGPGQIQYLICHERTSQYSVVCLRLSRLATRSLCVCVCVLSRRTHDVVEHARRILNRSRLLARTRECTRLSTRNHPSRINVMPRRAGGGASRKYTKGGEQRKGENVREREKNGGRGGGKTRKVNKASMRLRQSIYL